MFRTSVQLFQAFLYLSSYCTYTEMYKMASALCVKVQQAQTVGDVRSVPGLQGAGAAARVT